MCGKSTLVLVLLCIVNFVFCQIPLYTNHEHFDTEKGLPQSYVSALEQDSDGFIWVATLDGLARYDGQKFLLFNIDQPKNRQLSTSQVYDILLDENNFLWIFHHNYTVDRINTLNLQVELDIKPISKIKNDNFQLRHTSPNVSQFIDDLSGNWFAGDSTSYFLFDSSNLKMQRLFANPDNSQLPMTGFTEDSKGRLWYATQEALLVSNTSWTSFETIPFAERIEITMPKWEQFPMVVLPDDRILFFMVKRLFVYYEKRNIYREIQLPDLNYNSNNVYSHCIKFDKEGRPIFTYNGYIMRLEEGEQITVLWKNPHADKFEINDLIIDTSNSLWVGLNTGGLYKINLNTPSFGAYVYETNFLHDILTDQMGVSEDAIPTNWNKPGWAYGMRYCYFKDNLYLTHESYGFGSYRRIYDYKNGQFNRMPLEDIYRHYIIGIAENERDLWALDIEGYLFKWEDKNITPRKNRFKVIPDTGVERLSDLIVDDEYQWIINTKNILYQLKEGEIINEYQIGIKGSILVDMAADLENPDIIWIGSLGGGLIKWSKNKKNTLAIYTIEEGLSNNSIGAIVPDSQGNLWLGTFNGISRFNIANSSFTNYSTRDGIIESEFNRHHGFILPDGRIAFGGTKGYSIFNPKDFKSDNYHPTVSISDFLINSKPINELTNFNDTQVELNNLFDLELTHDQNSILIETAAMQYNNTESNKYRYRLDNFNNDWIDIGTQRTVRFDNLPYGNYTLHLNVSNTDGIWSDKIRSIQISIKPPPWLSWWAYSGYTIILTLIVYLFWKNYKQRLIKQQEEEINRRETIRLKEVDEMKTRFFSNITHEFRTPLTLILSPIEKHIKDSDFSPKALELLQRNYRHGSQLLKLVNQLLDIAKLESGNMQFHNSKGEPAKFVKACVDQFEGLAVEKGITITFSNESVDGHYLFDKGHWEKILNNLISNAIKFTSENGLISIFLKEEIKNDEPLITIIVKDTGIGITKELLPKLFDRFYQVDDSSTRAHEGTGIGLSLVKELTTLMKGEIKVESEEGKGTTFTVTIPVSKFVGIPTSSTPSVAINNNGKLATYNEDDPLLLVVEDNEELRSFVVESLSENWNVIEAANGKEAWKLIENKLPEIVISDVMMPEMNGIELCQMTKNDSRSAHINFIMLTAKTAQESKEQGLEAGADDYLTKPFHLYELELRIQNLIQQQQNLREHLQSELLASSPMEKIPNVDDEFLNKAYHYLNEHLVDSSLNIDKLATVMAMSKSTLNRKLKALLNISTNDFIKRYRLQKSIELINSGHNISETAFKVGFESPSYFSQCFKEVYNQSPSVYQKSKI